MLWPTKVVINGIVVNGHREPPPSILVFFRIYHENYKTYRVGSKDKVLRNVMGNKSSHTKDSCSMDSIKQCSDFILETIEDFIHLLLFN